MTQKFNPKNKTCVVTGGSLGIGRAIALKLLEQGADQIINIDWHASKYDSVDYLCDLRNKQELDQTLSKIVEEHDIDLYCSNAGTCLPDDHAHPKNYIDHWTQLININVMAHVIAVKHVMPKWLVRGQGHMLITASAAGLIGMPSSASYAVTKAGAIAYAEWLATAYTHLGIGCTVLCPKGVLTHDFENGTDLDQRLSKIMQPWTTADDVAQRVIDDMAEGKHMTYIQTDVHDAYIRKAQDTDAHVQMMNKVYTEFVEGCDYDKYPTGDNYTTLPKD